MDVQLFIGFLIFFFIVILFMPLGELGSKKNFKNLIEHINQKELETSSISAIGILEKLFRFSEKYYRWIKNLIKASDYKKISKQLQTAGISERVTVEGVLASRFVLAFFAFVYVFGFAVLVKLIGLAFVGILFSIFGYMIPELFIKNQIKVRQIQIEREIPGVLNTMAIMTEAGLGLFEAMEKVCEVKKGEFVRELKMVNEEVKVGTLRKEAFLKMSDRCEVAEVSTFVSALLQVLEKGAGGISEFIKEQADELWSKRLNKAKELGAKASLKLFFPMLLLVMPASLIFLAGPVVMSIIGNFLG
jgi:tight adherence protein C